jgi:hypothetical protein
MPVDDLLKAGIIAYQLEDLALARSCLSKAVAADPSNASAWLWLGRCLDDAEQKRYCFQQAVNLESDNLTARQALEDLDRQPAPRRPPRPLGASESYPDLQPQAIFQATEAPTQEVPFVAAQPAAAAPLPRKLGRFSRGILIGGVGAVLLACTALIVLLVLPRLGGSLSPTATQSAVLPTATQPVVLPTATQTMRPSNTPFPATWTMTATLTRRPSITPVPTSTQSHLSIDEIHGTLTALASQPPASASLPALTPEPPQATETSAGG